MRRRTESKTKKRMSAEDRKKAILETTVSFISQFGFWGFTIRDVAQAQNITEAGLLYYFKSKEQLLEATLKYADRTNQIAIAERRRRDRRSLTRRHRIPLRSRTQGHLHGNRGNQRRPTRNGSPLHPARKRGPKQRPSGARVFRTARNQSAEGIHVRSQTRWRRRSGTHRTAGAIRHGRLAIAVAQRISRYRFRWRMEGPDRPSHSLNVLFSSSLIADFSRRSPQHSSGRSSTDHPA